MKKKLWGIVFCLCLFAALLPATAAAAEDNVAKVGNTEYATIDEAIAAWSNGTTLTLLADVTLSDVIKLSSTEYHILDLGTYTMTAASKKDAIQIVNNGRSSASYTLDIKADATNPGGITASGKTVVVTTGKSGVQDRPIIRFYNGVFNASYIVKHSGSNGTNCPQFQFHGGVFNGTISTNRALNQFHGGTFTGSMFMSVDSSAYTLVAGGTFKNLTNSYGSALNSKKFTIGSAKGVYDRDVYIDASGYYVITATAPAEGYEASVSKTPGTNDYLAYSKVKADGKLNYTDVYTALDKNRTATVTVYVDELDLTNSSFKGTLMLPNPDSTLKVIYAEGTEPTWEVVPPTENENLMVVYEESTPGNPSSRTYVLKEKRYIDFITNGAPSIDELIVADGSKAPAPDAPERVGYNFEGWFIDEACETAWNWDDAVTAANVDNNGRMTLFAKWTIKTYSVTLNYGIDSVTNDELTVEHGTDLDLQNPNFAGYIFMGWYTDDTYTAKFDFTAPITGPVTLYAKFADYAGDMTAVNDEINSLKQNLEDTTTALKIKLDTKADAAEVSESVGKLKEAITNLQDAMAKTDADNKAELEAKIAAATETLGDAIKALEQNLNASTAALREKINTKADADEVNAALAELQSAIDALEAVKDDYITADAALKAELETKITDAKTAAVSASEALVSSAKADLQAKIDTKADAAAVNAAIAKLQNAITVLEKAKDDYAAADETLKAELEAAIAKAKQEAIDAAKGHIPHIGENGSWWIGESDTGVSASGIPGEPGKDGVTPQLRINSENIWEVSYDGGKTWESMGISAVGASGANGQNGAPGQDGSDGVGIANIEKTSSNGNVDIYTITLTNGKTFPFTVTNGVDGKDGADGADGADGKDGETISVVVPTVIGSAALVSNIGLIAWLLSKKKVPV